MAGPCNNEVSTPGSKTENRFRDSSNSQLASGCVLYLQGTELIGAQGRPLACSFIPISISIPFLHLLLRFAVGFLGSLSSKPIHYRKSTSSSLSCVVSSQSTLRQLTCQHMRPGPYSNCRHRFASLKAGPDECCSNSKLHLAC